MPAGVELDELVQMWVLGYERIEKPLELDGQKLSHMWVKDGKPIGLGQRDYSTGLSAAWVVFDALALINVVTKNDAGYGCGHMGEKGFAEKGRAQTVPLAICRAAMMVALDRDGTAR